MSRRQDRRDLITMVESGSFSERALLPVLHASLVLAEWCERTAFEHAYARRSGLTVRQLRALGRVVRPCDCGEDGCEGWQNVPVPTAAEIDDPSKPWAR